MCGTLAQYEISRALQVAFVKYILRDATKHCKTLDRSAALTDTKLAAGIPPFVH